MEKDYFKYLKDILKSALEHAPGDRSAFLDEVCREKPELRAEVRSQPLSLWLPAHAEPDPSSAELMRAERPARRERLALPSGADSEIAVVAAAASEAASPNPPEASSVSPRPCMRA